MKCSTERILQWLALAGVCAMTGPIGCTAAPTGVPPRYVWYCHIAGGGNCTGGMIRCRDRRAVRWVEEKYCSATEKPENLVNNQSYPPVAPSALLPGQ